MKFSYDGIFYEVLDELGEMPLPPYIKEQLPEKNVIKLFMQRKKDRLQHRRQGFILQPSF